jgi:hypothetical protein
MSPFLSLQGEGNLLFGLARREQVKNTRYP